MTLRDRIRAFLDYRAPIDPPWSDESSTLDRLDHVSDDRPVGEVGKFPDLPSQYDGWDR